MGERQEAQQLLGGSINSVDSGKAVHLCTQLRDALHVARVETSGLDDGCNGAHGVPTKTSTVNPLRDPAEDATGSPSAVGGERSLFQADASELQTLLSGELA